MEDVARLAGVSRGTVSNVLNNPAIVSPDTRERVLRAIEELGFVRNQVALALASGRTRTIGYVGTDLANSYFLDIARGIEERADESGYRVVLANSDVDAAKQRGYLELFDESRFAGVIVAPLEATHDEVGHRHRAGFPIVRVNLADPRGEGCAVVVDEEHSGYLAARHLLDLGRRRLVFAGGFPSLSAVRSRLHGAERAAAEVAGAGFAAIGATGLRVPAGLALGRELAALAPHERPDGVVAVSDAFAAGLIQSLLSAGIRVPDEVAVVGHDDNTFATEHVLPISTVSQPGVEMGRVAADLLLEELAGDGHAHRTVVLESRLIVRSSSVADDSGVHGTPFPEPAGA